MFFVAPVKAPDGKVIATLGVTVDPRGEFSQLARMGSRLESGESYAFDRGGKLINQSRFEDQLYKAGLLQKGASSIFNVEIRDPGVNLVAGGRAAKPRKEQPLTLMARQAIAGKSGIDMQGYNDYRGVPVVGVWRWDKDLGFGLATEMDRSEVYHHHYMYRDIFLALLGVVMTLCLAGYLLVNRGRRRALALARQAWRAEERFRNLVESTSDWIWEVDAGGVYTYASPAVEDILGYKPQEMIGKTLFDLMPPQESERVSSVFEELVKRAEPIVRLGHNNLHKDGRSVILETSGKPILSSQGELLGYRGIDRDITERKQAEDQLELSREVFDNAIEGIIATNAQGEIEYVNRAFTIINGYSAEEALGQNPRLVKSDRHGPDFYKKMWDSLIQHGQWQGEIWNRRKNGAAYPAWMAITAIKDARGKTTRYMGIFHDISDIKRAEEEVEYKANYDALTGLPNMQLFNNRLNDALSHLRQRGGKLAVLSVDLDNFKNVNNSLGHLAGDTLLQNVSRRLEAAAGEQATTSRLGGDEFLVMIEGLSEAGEAGEAVQVASNMIKKISSYPFGIKGEELFVTLGIGIAQAPDDGLDAGSLISNAGLAMRQAKQQGQSAYRFFSEAMNQTVVKRLHLEGSLHQALERDEFLVYYQPKVDLHTGCMVGMEALIRWQRQTGEIVPPDDFIPLTEETGLIVPIGEWVLRESCRQTLAWREAGHTDLRVAVNLSARQFKEANLVQMVEFALSETGLPVDGLELEITEGVFMEDLQAAQAVMHRFHEMGIKNCLDDFGTGYSSLSYLRRLPLDTIKMDKSFVEDLPDDPDAKALASAIISMAKSLNIKVVAEGVETQEQLDFLRTQHCDQMQGYFYSRPLPAHDFGLLLQEDKRLE